jgi:hypothetical protein
LIPSLVVSIFPASPKQPGELLGIRLVVPPGMGTRIVRMNNILLGNLELATFLQGSAEEGGVVSVPVSYQWFRKTLILPIIILEKHSAPLDPWWNASWRFILKENRCLHENLQTAESTTSTTCISYQPKLQMLEVLSCIIVF